MHINFMSNLSFCSLLSWLIYVTTYQQAFAFQSTQDRPSCCSTVKSNPQLNRKQVGDDPVGVCKSRRGFFNDVVTASLFPAFFLGVPGVANSAAPITPKETDSIGAMAKRAMRQKPPKLLRRKLSMDFAVLLMRSSYSALDQLDCVAMVSV